MGPVDETQYRIAKTQILLYTAMVHPAVGCGLYAPAQPVRLDLVIETE